MNPCLLAVSMLCQAQPRETIVHQHEEIEIVRTRAGYLLPQGVFEGDAVLSIFSFDEFRGNDDLEADLVEFRVEGAYAFLPWLMAEIEVPFRSVDFSPGDSEGGIGDIALEGKVSLMKDLSPIGFVPVNLAAGIRIGLPTGDEDEGLGEEHATFGIFGAVSHRFEPWFAIHGDVSTEVQSDERPVHRFNVAGEFTPWGAEFSLFGAFNFFRFGSDRTEATFSPGAEYRFVGSPIAVGAALALGLTDESPDWGLVFDVELRL